MLNHHLRASRSNRILWSMEELGQPYEIRIYERDPDTMRAKLSLAASSSFGQAPAIEDDDLLLVGSMAIKEHVLSRHAIERLQPEPETDGGSRKDELMHFAEASAIPADVVEKFGAEIPDARGGYWGHRQPKCWTGWHATRRQAIPYERRAHCG